MRWMILFLKVFLKLHNLTDETAPSQMWNQTDMGYRKAVKLSLKNSLLFCLSVYGVTSRVFLSERHWTKNGSCGILSSWKQENGIKSNWNIFEVSKRKLVGMILKSQDVLKLYSWFSDVSSNWISKPPKMFLSLKLDRFVRVTYPRLFRYFRIMSTIDKAATR